MGGGPPGPPPWIRPCCSPLGHGLIAFVTASTLDSGRGLRLSLVSHVVRRHPATAVKTYYEPQPQPSLCIGCRPRTGKMERSLVRPLNAIFSCNLSAVDRRVFLRGFMRHRWTLNMSFSQQSFRSCNHRRRFQLLASCLGPLAEKCRRSDIIAVKVIRLHMDYVDQMMAADPQLRLIHVVRDPRGLVESWRKVGGLSIFGIHTTATHS